MQKSLNFNFRATCGAKSDFFYCYEEIVNINPICKSEEEFKIMMINLPEFTPGFAQQNHVRTT